MLKSLSVKNYALIADAEIQFGKGLNILTGETGAGKSIILEALGTILGDRIDTSVLRDGAEKATIEGYFILESNTDLTAYLNERDVDSDDGQLFLRREIYRNGRTRAFVNDTPVQLSILQEVGDFLVDLHGQHEHQSLLKTQNHLKFLDEFGELEGELKEVEKAFKSLQTHLSELRELEQKQKTVQERKEYYLFQINEINKVNPLPGEEEDLLREEKIVQHSERLYNLTNELYRILYENENSAFDQLSRVQNGLLELMDIDDKFAECKSDCESATVIVDELAKFLQDYNSNIEFNPERLEKIQNRISELSGLKKKYGRTTEDILELRDEIQIELDSLANLTTNIESLRERIDSEKKRFSVLCLDLSKKRRSAAKNVENIVPDVLSYLGMSGSRFNVALTYHDDPVGLVEHQGKTYRASADGIDFAQFLLSTNVGEDVRPLAKIASGGEISRIMLALKSIMAKEGHIPVLVFDEIDIGVSGRIAQAVGRKLRALSDLHQVICITHLPQIASMGDQHYFVEKFERSGRIETTIRKLSSEERTEAIAKLLAGERVSETHLNSARELLQDRI